jgi:hypothetical protein
MTRGIALIAWVAIAASPISAAGANQTSNALAIIQNAVAANDRDWKAQPAFSHTERYIKSKFDADGQATVSSSRTSEVLMIDGSPYSRLIAINNEPLSGAKRAAEQTKLEREIAIRRNESESQRRSRIGKYKEERSEEHLLMREMVAAFHFKLIGQEEVEGVSCYRFEATPNADYRPPVEKARVLKGMRGHMWIDSRQYHWVKVQADVFEPVSFGFFIAKVNPGTRFELDQQPFDKYWVPKHFIETVNANLFGLYGHRSKEETFYSNYQQAAAPKTEVFPR